MSDSITYQNEQYSWRGGRWYDASGLLAPAAIVSALHAVRNRALAAAPTTRTKIGRGRTAVVDAANVAFGNLGAPRALLRHVLWVRDWLLENGFVPVMIADASLRHRIDDRDGYELMVRRGEIREVPSGTPADGVILREARRCSGVVVSNDLFRDWSDVLPEEARKALRLVFTASRVTIYKSS